MTRFVEPDRIQLIEPAVSIAKSDEPVRSPRAAARPQHKGDPFFHAAEPFLLRQARFARQRVQRRTWRTKAAVLISSQLVLFFRATSRFTMIGTSIKS